MARRKKKNAITLIILLLALAALVGAYVWYGNNKTKKESTSASDTEKISLATVDTKSVTGIHYKNKDTEVNFILDNGVWKSKDEPDRPINQENVNGLLSTISTINAYKEMTKATDLSEYGLENPETYVQATLKDGSTVTLKLGNEVVGQKGYYALVNDKKTVYLVDISYGSGLSFTDLDFTAVEKAPEITAENINYISIDSRDGADVELKQNDSGRLDNSGSNMFNWDILKPYGNGYSADKELISSMEANYTSFDYGDCVDYKGNDLGKYGLDNPAYTIDIGYYETQPSATPAPTPAAGSPTADKISKEYKIYIGNKDDSNNYYVKVDGTNAVYTLSADTVDKMLQVNAFSLINPYPDFPNIDTVDKIGADISGSQYTMEIKHTASASKDNKKDGSSDKASATYYYNGKEAEEHLFKKVYQVIISAKYDGELKDKVDTASLKPVMTLSFNLNNTDKTVIKTSFLPYNDSFYIADKGNGVYFLVDKRTIDDMAKEIQTFK